MIINGIPVGSSKPRANWNQTDESKADFILGKQTVLEKISEAADAARTAQEAADTAQDTATGAQYAADSAQSSANAAQELGEKAIEDIASLNGQVSRLKYAEVTLTANGWTGEGPYTQSVEVDGMTDAWVPGIPSIVPGDTAEYDLAAREALSCVTKITSTEDGLEFVCYEEKPEADVTIRIPGLLA